MESHRLEVIYIVPSRYDEDGYVFRWFRGVVPSNSLSCLKGLTESLAAENRPENVEVTVRSYDDSIETIPIRKIIRKHRRGKTKVLVGLVGVQSGQFARASDLALQLRAGGVPVIIGGFHVSGMLALFDEPSPDLSRLLDAGVSLVQGEAESPGGLEGILGDAARGELKPIYRFPLKPDIAHAPLPTIEPKYLKRFAVQWGTIDTSRGCPFGCTFCTIINVQGRKMRCRSAEAVLHGIREGVENGVSNYFFTDDNFSRSSSWKPILQGLIQLREEEGIDVSFMIQVDTQAYKIPDFLELVRRAGCRMVFVGMESVNPQNLEAAGKSQNDIGDYRRMVRAWQDAGILVHVGYIIGFPFDTAESVKRDVALLSDHIGVNEASFFMLTPLPGSVDHKNMLLSETPLDEDLNDYDSWHETYRHLNMPEGEWRRATEKAYADFYDHENVVNILLRTPKKHYWYMFSNCIWYRYSGVFNKTHPMSTGFFRRKPRKDRRPEFPRENIFRFGWRRLRDVGRDMKYFTRLFFEFREIWILTAAKPAKRWSTLSEVRERWLQVQEKIAEYQLSNRTEEAYRQLRRALESTLTQVRNMLRSGEGLRRSQLRKLERSMHAVETFLKETTHQPPDANTLKHMQQMLRNSLIATYEEITCRYLSLHRWCTRHRRSIVRQIKHGRLWNYELLLAPVVLATDTMLSVRFGVSALLKF